MWQPAELFRTSIILSAAAILLGMGLFTVSREIDIFRNAAQSDWAVYLGTDGTPANIRSAARVPGFVNCRMDLRRELSGPNTSAESVNMIADRCIALLTEALRRTPADGDSWFELGRLLILRDGLGSEAEKALLMSYQTAPAELWISQRRLGLLANLWEIVSNDLQDRLRNEVLIIARSWDGLRTLADIYLGGTPAAQSLIVSILEEEDTQLQRRFISAVRSRL